MGKKKGILKKYCDVVRDLIETYTINAVIVETEEQIMRLTPTLNDRQIDNAELAEPNCCNAIASTTSTHKIGTLLKGCKDPFHQNMCFFKTSIKYAAL